MLVGAKLALTPVGMPMADRATADLKPFSAAVARVMVEELPGAIVAVITEGVRVNMGELLAAPVRALRQTLAEDCQVVRSCQDLPSGLT
jgi:hypothetical protein